MKGYLMQKMFEWTYIGVDHSLKGNGGLECASFIPTYQKIIETIVFASISFSQIYISASKIKLPEKINVAKNNVHDTGKNILLMLMCLTFGIEIGFKFATKQLIWILNPCHLVTTLQIFLLAAPPSRLTMLVFRLMLHMLNGATIAIIFPVINTRLLPFETEVYYIQHILMLIIPFYLLRIGGVYTPEPATNFWYPVMSMGLLYFYHWTLLQYLALASLVNLNNMMCPAVSDPFYGRGYRVCAAIHQGLLIPIHGKIYTLVSQRIIPQQNSVAPDSQQTMNGHAKIH